MRSNSNCPQPSATIIAFQPLIDGSLSSPAISQRATLVADMATDLLNAEAYADLADATLCLMGRYSVFEIFSCRHDAIEVAAQHAAVMREMANG